jgi:signal transduction histidine kinase
MDARELLDSLLRFHKRSPEAGGRHVRLAELPSDVEFESDEVLVRRVLGNMVKNALEAVGRHGTVTIGCETGPGGPVFSVNNPGVMDRETVNQIFQRSFSTKGRGRGLGTYGMKLFAERYLGGRVWFESNRERGTTFFLALPFSPNADGS